MKVFIVFSFLLTTVAFANFQEFDQFIEQARREFQVPGVAVAIVEGDKVTFSKGHGVRHIDNNEPVNDQTIFQLASVSKTFTSAALGVQVDKGKITWEDAIIQHLPECILKEPYPTKYVNTRDLLAHRTGLPAFGGDLLGKLGYSSEEILNRVQYIVPASSFRDVAHYSNVGYFIAGELLAKLAGESFENTIKEMFLTPLSMHRSGFSETLADANVAYAHAVVDGKIQVVPWDRSRVFAAAGGITSTALDMTKWLILQLNGGSYFNKQIVKDKTLKEIHMPSMVAEIAFSEFPPIDENSSYSFSLGWDTYHYNDRFIVEKGGGLDGIRTIVTLIPELKVGIVVLSNLNLVALPEMIRAKFLEIYAGPKNQDVYQKIRSKNSELMKLIAPPELPKVILPKPFSIDHYEGEYESELYGTIMIEAMNDDLKVIAGPGKLQGSITHYGNNSFFLEWEGVNTGKNLITFCFGFDGKVVEIQTETFGSFYPKKID